MYRLPIHRQRVFLPVPCNDCQGGSRDCSGAVFSVTTRVVEILFADEHIIVVNKPSHLLSVAGIGPEKQDCVVRRMADEFGGWVREVHRLDWETSGLLALARTPDAHRNLMKQFHDRLVDKSYTAVVAGVPRCEKGTISLPLCVDWP